MEKVFEANTEYLNDLAGIDYTTNHIGAYYGFDRFSEIFCDNIILWCATLLPLVKTKARTICYYIQLIRDSLLYHFTESEFSLKFVFIGDCKDYQYLTTDMFSKIEMKNSCKNGRHGYLAIKVSFNDISFEKVLTVMKLLNKSLLDNCVAIHDIDLFVDCCYITTREIVRCFLLNNGILSRSIVNDRNSVGNDCISWYVHGKQFIKIRNKVYNKFVQMLQSTDINSKLGCQLYNFVANPSAEFTHRFLNYRSCGMSRLEFTFYSSNLYQLEYYLDHLHSTLLFLRNLSTYEVPFQNQWANIIKRLNSACFIYDKKSKILVYCHWWNSITCRKNGVLFKGIDLKYIMNIIANFSFNDRNSFLIMLDNFLDSPTSYSTRIFQRISGSTGITFTAGARNSPYPSSLFFKQTKVLSFHEVGLISIENITFGWPSIYYDKRTAPVAPIIELSSNLSSTKSLSINDEVNRMTEIVNIPTKLSKADYDALTPNTQYTFIAFGYKVFYKKLTLFLQTKESIYVRASSSLTSIFNQHREKNSAFLQVKIINKIKTNGKRDLNCQKI
jgi:hypothetical protein